MTRHTGALINTLFWVDLGICVSVFPIASHLLSAVALPRCPPKPPRHLTSALLLKQLETQQKQMLVLRVPEWSEDRARQCQRRRGCQRHYSGRLSNKHLLQAGLHTPCRLVSHSWDQITTVSEGRFKHRVSPRNHIAVYILCTSARKYTTQPALT